MSADDNFESHWMIFDINTQRWTFFMSDLSFVFNCCYGNMLTLRNVHYYFNNDVGGVTMPWLNKPIYRILDNGTSIDLESEIPFAWTNSYGEGEDLSIVQAPFYQRFYEEVQTKR